MFERPNDEPSSLMINRKMSELVSAEVKTEKGEAVEVQKANQPSSFPKYTLQEALKLKELYIISILFSCSTKAITVYTNNYKVRDQYVAISRKFF